MNEFRTIGFVIGLLVGLILVTVIFKYANKDKKCKTEYDERQLLIRGKAYKIAFWVLSVCMCVCVVVDMLFPHMVPLFAAAFGSFMISGSVLAVYCIAQGAYWGLNNNRMRYIIIFVAAGLINMAACVCAIIRGQMIVDGELQLPLINLMTGVMLLVVGIAIAVDYVRNSEKGED